MAHPLLGANIATLARVFREGGGAHRWADTLAIWGAALARIPFSVLERALVARWLAKAPEMPPPIFILGHWRSGTTHLYNLMSGAGFGYVPPLATGLPWEMFVLAGPLRPLLERQLPEHRYVDSMEVTPTSPQEDEIALANMSPLSFYHGIYFPRAFDPLIDRGVFLDGCSEGELAEWQARFAYFLRKLHLAHGRRMLVKNPVYTARPAMLRELFPGAKFIHIHRNPYDVFLSTRNFYSRLLETLALQPVPDDLDIDATILRVYPRMMRRFERETEGWAAPDFVDLSYEFLDREPLAALQHIYEALGLEGFDAALPQFTAHLEHVRGHRKHDFCDDAEVRDKVSSALGHWIAKWGYADPASVEAPR